MNQEIWLIHVFTDAALLTTNKELPDWGYKQLEVACDRESKDHRSALWVVDDHLKPGLKDKGETVRRKHLNFWDKLEELHLAMFKANNQLTVRNRWGGGGGGDFIIIFGLLSLICRTLIHILRDQLHGQYWQADWSFGTARTYDCIFLRVLVGNV